MGTVTWLIDGEEIDDNSTFKFQHFISDPFQSVYYQTLEIPDSQTIIGSLFSCEVSDVDGISVVRSLVINGTTQW